MAAFATGTANRQQESPGNYRRRERPEPKTRSLIGRVVLSLSAIAVCTKLFGFAEKVVVAHFFGTSETADIYFASTSIVLSIVYLVKELVYPSLLPVFASSLNEPRGVSGALFRRAFLWTAVVLAIIALIFGVFPRFLTNVFVPGFSQAKRRITSELLRMLTPGMFCLGLTMMTYTILNAHRRFLRAAWPEAALKLLIVVGLIALIPQVGIFALAVVMSLGALGCLLAQLYFIPERTFLLKRQTNAAGDRHMRRVLLLMGPLVVGVVFSHVSGLVDNLLASTLPRGQLSYLGYSKKLIDAILLIGPVALVTVVYSKLSHLAAAGDYERFTALVARAFRVLVYLSVPVACIVIGLKQPLVRLLFQRGQFDAGSTLGTAQSLGVYACGLVAFSLESLFVYSFFALSDTKTPVKYGVLCVFLDIGLAILLLKPFQWLGIAGAFLISKTIKTVILAIVLHKKLGGLFKPGTAGFLTRLAVAGGALWVALKLLLGIDNPDSFFHTAVWDLVLPAAGAMSAFALFSYLLRIDELRVASFLRKRKILISWMYGEAK
ncbi:MAG: murein biosynthesis integral membrane protein MurJ [Planctomycetota bacterium]|jgi:murein biosynthesis integral membrane protein MurJ